MKKLSKKNVERLLKRRLRVLMLFLLWAILRKKCWKLLKKTMTWWRYVDDIFFILEHGQESLNVFIDQVDMFHPTIKFMAEHSKEEVNFLDLNIELIDGELKTDFFV